MELGKIIGRENASELSTLCLLHYVGDLILLSANPESSYLYQSGISFYQRVKEDMIQSFEHQNYPFDVLLEELDVERNPGRNPIFDILVDYHGASETGRRPKNEDSFIIFKNKLTS